MSRRPGNPFTLSEKHRILKYIIEKEAYCQVKGNSLWKGMQAEFQGCHTWHSLKEHFKKQLYPKLASSELKLTTDQIQNFRRGFAGLLRPTSRTARSSCSPPSFYRSDFDDDDDEVSASSTQEDAPVTTDQREREEANQNPSMAGSPERNPSEPHTVENNEPGTSRSQPQCTTAAPDVVQMKSFRPLVCYSISSDEEESATGSQTLPAMNVTADSDETYCDDDDEIDNDSLHLK